MRSYKHSLPSRMLLISVPLHNISIITKRFTACKWDSPRMSSQLLVFCDRETLSYHIMVRFWSRSILERSCHLPLRRHSAMRTTEARISMTPSLVTVWGTVVLSPQTPSRGQLSRRSQDVQMIQWTEAKSLHWEKTHLTRVHSFPVTAVPARFRFGQLLQVWKPERAIIVVWSGKPQIRHKIWCPTMSDYPKTNSRIFLHLSHAAQQGNSKAFIRTVDSDVVIIGVEHFGSLGVMELWIGFGTGKSLPTHEMCCSWTPPNTWSWEVAVMFTVPFVHGVWYDIIVPWYREKDSLGSMAGIPWSYGNTTHSFRWSYIRSWHSPPCTWHALNTGLLSCTPRAVAAQGWMMWYVNSSPMVLRPSTTSPHTGNAASTCKASSVPGRLHMETSKAATSRCPGCFSVGLDARREHETLGTILDCSRRRQQSVCSAPPLWMWKGVQRKLQMCQSKNQMHYSV